MKKNKKDTAVKNRKYRGKGNVRNDVTKRSDGNRYSEEPEVKGGSNDPSWYTRNNQLALDSGRIAFTWPVGNKLTMFPDDSTLRIASDQKVKSIPGIMTLGVVPMIGISKDNSSPINTAARNIYSFVRHANSGHANYDAPDLMMYLLAMDSLYSVYGYMARAYGALNVYSQRNRYLPKAVITAMGLDFNDFLANLADFRYFINSMAVKIGSLCTPNSFPYYTRHQWMFTGIYADSNDPKAQLYMYVPDFFLQYDENSGAGMLNRACVLDVNTPKTFSALKTEVLNMIDAVMGSEDMNIMSGDILKAFGSEGVFKIAQISEAFTVLPEFNEEVLRQFQNATVCPSFKRPSTGWITQDATTGALLCNPEFSTNGEAVADMYKGYRMIASGNVDPSPEEVLVSTRMTNTFSTRATSTGLSMDSCGSEFISSCFVWFMNFSSGTPTVDYNGFQMASAWRVDVDALSVFRTSARLANLNHFHYHPYIMEGMTNSASLSTNIQSLAVYFEVDNFAVIGKHELEKMHETALLSMFNVPQMGSSFGSQK